MECRWAKIHVKCKKGDKAHILLRIKKNTEMKNTSTWHIAHTFPLLDDTFFSAVSSHLNQLGGFFFLYSTVTLKKFIFGIRVCTQNVVCI